MQRVEMEDVYLLTHVSTLEVIWTTTVSVMLETTVETNIIHDS